VPELDRGVARAAELAGGSARQDRPVALPSVTPRSERRHAKT